MYTHDKLNQLKLPYDDIYIFHNLTHLEIQNNWDTVLRLLHLCPKLQNLKLGQKYNVANWDGEDDHESFAEPEFFILNDITYRLYLGLWKELSLSLWLLER
ncbi:hypothetical protein P8452_03847 [Trifolium repens]|nr:hypothetical protein P8452_03847 [Trifolium repens]